MQHLLQRVEDLGAAAQRLAKRVEAPTGMIMNSWKSTVVGVRAAVDDVHHRHGQHAGVDAAEVAVERQAERVGRGLGGGQRTPRIALAPSLALFAVPSSSIIAAVEPDLVGGVEADERVGRSRR